MNDEQDEAAATGDAATPIPTRAAPSPVAVASPPLNRAPRPHWITIVLGLVSPAAAIVALYLSAQSLETSRMSMRVAQRAYVALRNGQIRESAIMPALVAEGAPVPRDKTVVLFRWGFEIHNLGQTPASAIEYTMRFELPGGWRLRAGGDRPQAVSINTVRGAASDIAQGSLINHLHIELFDLTDEAVERWQSVHTDRALRVHGVLTYRDVFNDEHQLTWCWEEIPAYAPRRKGNHEERHLGVRSAIECSDEPRTYKITQ